MSPIFDATEELRAGRIVLSALDAEALGAMHAWLALSLAPDWPDYALSAAVESSNAIFIREAATDAAIGAAVALQDAPLAGAAAIPFISIDPTRRYRGLGGEATLALERHLRERFGVSSVYAPIPDWRGLAVYFWLRQGYRPVSTAEAPWPLTGLVPEPRRGIWMLRDIP
jgi:hypothetical protein